MPYFISRFDPVRLQLAEVVPDDYSPRTLEESQVLAWHEVFPPAPGT